MSAEKYLLETLKNSSKEDMDDYKAWLGKSLFWGLKMMHLGLFHRYGLKSSVPALF